MRVVIKENYDSCSKWAASYIAGKINKAQTSDGKPFVLGLPTGSTPLGTYKELIKLYKAGKVTKDDVYNLSDMVLGTWPGRTDDSQIINCSSLGLGALDIMIGYQIFLKAQEMGIGTTVKMWDKPLWE